MKFKVSNKDDLIEFLSEDTDHLLELLIRTVSFIKKN